VRSLLSFIPTIVGIAMTWTAIWLAGPPTLAAAISLGALILFGGSILAGLRRRRAGEGRPLDPEEAWATYRRMRSSAIFSAVVTPFVIAMFVIDIDPPLARWLGAGGVAVLFISGIRNERHILASVRDRAERASSSPAAAADGP
jgi:hypothetical protein